MIRNKRSDSFTSIVLVKIIPIPNSLFTNLFTTVPHERGFPNNPDKLS